MSDWVPILMQSLVKDRLVKNDGTGKGKIDESPKVMSAEQRSANILSTFSLQKTNCTQVYRTVLENSDVSRMRT